MMTCVHGFFAAAITVVNTDVALRSIPSGTYDTQEASSDIKHDRHTPGC